MQQSVPKAIGSGLTKLRKKEEWAAKEIHLTGEKHNVSELPKSPKCSSLIALYLQGNYELTAIPSLFFQRMARLQVLDLSRTSIKSLPKSLAKLVVLKKLLLQGCDLFLELSPQVGKLKNLEELDLDETQIMDLPRETGKLLNLRKLKVSFYHISGKKKLKSNVVIHPETISNLSQLAELSIDVNPADKRWDDSVEAVVKEVNNSKTLRTLSLYLPKFQLLDNTSLLYPSLSRFKFTVGHHKRRIISRIPTEVEAEFRNWDKCLKFVNGESVPIEIKGVLKYSTSFFLDHHATAMKLSEFGIENMKGLKFCLLAECNKMETLIDGEMHYEKNEDDQSESDPGSVEHVLESLEYLSIYYMENLQSIWRGANCFGCMSKLKFLALHTCPQLSEIFSQTLLENFVSLEEIILGDCPQVTSLVSLASIKPMMSDKIFLPSLKRLLLLYLPELVSISNGLLIAPKLESIGCYNCPKLKSISKMELSSKTLRIIRGERQWWEDMNWNETEWGKRPEYLMRIFSPIDNKKDVMTQMAEDKDLLEATIQNEGQKPVDEKLLKVSTQDHKGHCLDYKEERIIGTDVTKSPSACMLQSNPLLKTSHAPEQAWSFSSKKKKNVEDDYFDLTSKFCEVDVDEDEPKAKRWICTEDENKGVIGSISKTTSRHESAHQFRSKVLDDGYKWRKYGEKMVLGNPYPRCYYKCSTWGCPAKKRVDQDSQDKSFFITTYNGIHKHNGRYVGRFNLHPQPCNDLKANTVEDAVEETKTISPTKGYRDVLEASVQVKDAHQEYADSSESSILVESQQSEDENMLEVPKQAEDQHSDSKMERTRTNVTNIIPSTLPTMSPPAPELMRPAKLPDHPALMKNSIVLPSPTTGEFAGQPLNQKSTSGNDQQSITQEDNNSSDVCHFPPASSSSASLMISELSAATLPTAQVQAQGFEELAEQNQSKGNLQLLACYDTCYEQDSDLVKSRKSADAYTWRFFGIKGLTGNRRRSFYRCTHPGCRAKKLVERSLDGQITKVMDRASHNHPESQPTRTSSLSAFSRVIRASNQLTIKIPDVSIVTYEGGQMDADGLVFFTRLVADENRLQNLMDKKLDQPSDGRKADIGVDVFKDKKWKCAKTGVIFTSVADFKEVVLKATGMPTNKVQLERTMRRLRSKEVREERDQVIEANLKEISGHDVQCVKQNAADHSKVAKTNKPRDLVKATPSSVDGLDGYKPIGSIESEIMQLGWINSIIKNR